MDAEWTAQRVKAMKRNAAIIGRNRFMENFNAMFGTSFPEIPLEPLPEAAGRDTVGVKNAQGVQGSYKGVR